MLPGMREDVRRLVAQGRRDLESAGINADAARYEVAAFLAQQAVEKYLKAAWMGVLRREQPHTHSLLELARPLEPPAGLGPRLAYLNLDYTVARYPDAANAVPYELYDQQTAGDKLAIAEAAFRWIDSLFATTND
jgi:HEPN domain-containing protein